MSLKLFKAVPARPAFQISLFSVVVLYFQFRQYCLNSSPVLVQHCSVQYVQCCPILSKPVQSHQILSIMSNSILSSPIRFQSCIADLLLINLINNSNFVQFFFNLSRYVQPCLERFNCLVIKVDITKKSI